MSYYLRDGSPTDMRTWADKHSDLAYRVVKQETVGHLWVSTVWLGLDHGLFGGLPLIFETMVFPSKDGGEPERFIEEFCERYSTDEAAVAGHARAVEWAREHQPAATP